MSLSRRNFLGVIASTVLISQESQAKKYTVSDLGDNDFNIREKASEYFTRNWEKHLPELEDGLKSKDCEIKVRCRAILHSYLSEKREKKIKNTIESIKKSCLGQLPWIDNIPGCTWKGVQFPRGGNHENSWQEERDSTEQLIRFIILYDEESDPVKVVEQMKQEEIRRALENEYFLNSPKAPKWYPKK